MALPCVAQGEGGFERRFADPDGGVVPLATDDQLLDFLRTAEVVSSREIPAGINKPLKLLLEQDGVRMHAVFRTVDRFKDEYRTQDKRLILRFHDSHVYEVAAYRLARVLGISRVPPAALREVGGEAGSIQVWIEGARTETERREAGEAPPGSLMWIRQWQLLRAFDELIDNFDRNIGNVLVDQDWRIWLVDHTRSFTIHRSLQQPKRLIYCERTFWRGLQDLDQAEVEELVGDVLNKQQLIALMKRRDQLVKYFRKLIAKKGEEAVLFDLDPSGVRPETP